jgi:hypothetical protein
MNQLQLNGEIDNRDETIEELRAENRRLYEEIRQIKLQLVQSKSDNEAVLTGVQEVRNILTPLYRGLRLTFGEIDALPLVPTASNGASAAAGNPKRAVWDKWIEKFGDSLQAKMIDALLSHGPMSTEQLRITMQCSGQSVINTYNRLLKHGLISKSGGKYSLKEL